MSRNNSLHYFYQDNLSKPVAERQPFWILTMQEMIGWQRDQLEHVQNHLHFPPNR